MRLIDADALKEKIEFHPTSVSVCMTAAEAKGQTYFKNRCLEDIANAPTIDAVPVEWLFDWRDRALKEGMNPELVEWIEYILQIWSREKDAR